MIENKTKHIYLLAIDDKTVEAAKINPFLYAQLMDLVAIYPSNSRIPTKNGILLRGEKIA